MEQDKICDLERDLRKTQRKCREPFSEEFYDLKKVQFAGRLRATASTSLMLALKLQAIAIGIDVAQSATFVSFEDRGSVFFFFADFLQIFCCPLLTPSSLLNESPRSPVLTKILNLKEGRARMSKEAARDQNTPSQDRSNSNFRHFAGQLQTYETLPQFSCYN